MSRPVRSWGSLLLAVAVLGGAAFQAADSKAMIAEVVRTGSVIVSGIRFDPGSREPTADSDRALDALRAMLLEHTEWTFEVQDHTDETRDPEQDRALSTARAEAVVRWLTTHGIAQERLVPRGYGSTRPLRKPLAVDPALQRRRIELRKLNEE